VVDRGERITSQSFDATALTAERVNRIRSESARDNIGDIERTLNVPVLPLVILSRRVQPQFRFKVDTAGGTLPRGAEQRVPDTPNFRVSAEVWIVRFEERTRPTLVRTPRGASIPSRGRFWIEPQTGRVLMSELITENDDVRAQVNVSYQSEPGWTAGADRNARVVRSPDPFVDSSGGATQPRRAAFAEGELTAWGSVEGLPAGE
jgi:hypothetical protein